MAMWRTTWRSLGAHKRRLLATCSAVLLGVAFLSGTLVLGDTMTHSFGEAFAEANAGTDAVVRSGVQVGAGEFTERSLLDRALVDEIAALDGVAAAEPRIEGLGRIVGADGDPIGGNGPPTLAGNWIDDDALNPYDLAEGRAPAGPGEVVIDRAAAREGDLAVGDRTTVRTPDPVEVTVVGLVTFGSADSQGPVTYAAFSTDVAEQVLLAEPGKVSSVVVAAEPGVGQEEIVERIEAVLPAGVESLTGAELTAEMEDDLEADFLGFLKTALLVFAGVALVVATFSIYNTFSILVAQRTRESALLRALGASQGQVLRSLAAEAAVVGVLASAAGLAAGVGLATGLVSLMDAMGLSLPTSTLLVEVGSLATAAAVGVVVTLVASLAPAVRAARVAPLAALREVAVDRSGVSWVRGATGAAVTAAGVALAVVGATGRELPVTGLGALLTLTGVVVLGPVVARPAAAVLGAPLAAGGRMSGTLARRNAMRNPRRTASTAAALMIGVAVVSLFTVVAASVKRSMNEAVEEQFAGDLVVMADGFGVNGLSAGIAPAVAELPEVAHAAAGTNAAVRVDGRDTVVAAYDTAALDAVVDLGTRHGSLGALTAGEVAVSAGYADDHDLAAGDAVEVAYPDGVTERATVGAVYARQELFGEIILPRAAFEAHTARPTDRAVLVALADGVGIGEGERAVQRVVDRFGGPDVLTNDEYVQSIAGQVDQMLTVVYALLVLAIVIALMGIANTLSLSVHERTRELGLLRAVGQSRRQLRSTVRGEALTVALFGTAIGVGLGLFLGWAMVEALADEGFTSFAVPGGSLALVLALGALVGVVAALRPARRAARLDVLAAIASE